jgi:hypothetical protein
MNGRRKGFALARQPRGGFGESGIIFDNPAMLAGGFGIGRKG